MQAPPWRRDPHSQSLEVLIQVSVLLGLPKLSLSAVVARSSLQARTELEKRIHPCQQEKEEDLRALQQEGTSAH